MATIQDALAIAWKLFQSGDRAGALRVYHKVAEIDPSVVAAWQMIGAINQVEGRFDLGWPATSECSGSILTTPKHSTTWGPRFMLRANSKRRWAV